MPGSTPITSNPNMLVCEYDPVGYHDVPFTGGYVCEALSISLHCGALHKKLTSLHASLYWPRLYRQCFSGSAESCLNLILSSSLLESCEQMQSASFACVGRSVLGMPVEIVSHMVLPRDLVARGRDSARRKHSHEPVQYSQPHRAIDAADKIRGTAGGMTRTNVAPASA